MSDKLAYEIIEQNGQRYYRYPVTGFTTPHLRNMKNHIRKRDPEAVLELPEPKEEKPELVAAKAPAPSKATKTQTAKTRQRRTVKTTKKENDHGRHPPD